MNFVRAPSRSSRAEQPTFAAGSGAAAFTRFASEGWWARQDSNLQPDRYERPALTIELQAPPRAIRLSREQTAVPAPLTMRLAIRQCWVRDSGYLLRVVGKVFFCAHSSSGKARRQSTETPANST